MRYFRIAGPEHLSLTDAYNLPDDSVSYILVSKDKQFCIFPANRIIFNNPRVGGLDVGDRDLGESRGLSAAWGQWSGVLHTLEILTEGGFGLKDLLGEVQKAGPRKGWF